MLIAIIAALGIQSAKLICSFLKEISKNWFNLLGYWLLSFSLSDPELLSRDRLKVHGSN